MKIDGVDPLKNIPGSPKPPASQPVSGPSFADLLQQATGAATPTATPKTTATGPVSPTPFLMPVESANAAPARDDIFKSLDGLMTDLDMLQNALGNNDVPLGRMAPLMDALVARKDDISQVVNNVEDPELRALLSDALSLVIDQVDQYQSGYSAS